MLNPIFIEARDLPDAWFQCVFSILENGKVFTIDKGSFEGQKRLEFDYITIHIKYPNTRPLIPKIAPHFGIPDPVTDEYIDDYLPYLMTGEVKPGESYTYGQRMCKFPITEKQKENITIDKDIWKNDKIVFEENGKYIVLRKTKKGICANSENIELDDNNFSMNNIIDVLAWAKITITE